MLALGGPAAQLKHWPRLVGYGVATCGGPLAGWHLAAPPPKVPQPAPGPTWGSEVLRPHTFLVDLRDFCRRGGRWGSRAEGETRG